MMNKVVDVLNQINNGDEINFSIPLNNSTIDVSGTAYLDQRGNIVVKTTSINAGDLSIENGIVTIEKGKSLAYGDDINIHINGDGKIGEVSENINDAQISISNNQVTVSNTPLGMDEGTFDINDNFQFNIHKSDGQTYSSEVLLKQNQSGSYGSGKMVTLATNKDVDKSTIKTTTTNNQKNTKENNVTAATGDLNTNTKSGKGDTSEVKDITQFEARDHSDYWKAEFQTILNDTSDKNYDTLAKQLQSDVDSLQKDFAKVKDQITLWEGSASDSTKQSIQKIIGKFDCTMDNINNAIGPACSKIEDFKEKLELLKKGKEDLTGEDGNGGLDKELEELTKDYEEKKTTYDNLKSNEPPVNKWVSDDKGGHNEHNPAHDTWETNVASAETAMNEAESKVTEMQELIKTKEAELDKLLDEVLATYTTIKNLASSISTFKDFLGDKLQSGNINSASDFVNYYDRLLTDINKFSFASSTDYSKGSAPVLADEKFFEKACNAHSSEGWKIENGVVTMVIDGKTCTYDTKRHIYSTGDRNTQLETYIYLPSHIVESGDYSALENLNTYTYFTSSQNMYVNAIDKEEINTITMKVVKSDPFNSKYDTVESLTKMTNTVANTDLSKCENIIGGDSVYGAHSLKIAASTGDLYSTVYCIDNAAIVTGYNGKAGTKEQFDSLEDLKGLDGKNIYFINTSGDDNYAMGADMSVERGRAYVPVGSNGNISVDQVKNSFTYTGIELVAKNCPNSKIHIVYQDQDTAKSYQSTNFPIALDQLASQYSNVWNDSDSWDDYISKKYKTHSEGNYIAADLASAETTNNPNYDNNYNISA